MIKFIFLQIDPYKIHFEKELASNDIDRLKDANQKNMPHSFTVNNVLVFVECISISINNVLNTFNCIVSYTG